MMRRNVRRGEEAERRPGSVHPELANTAECPPETRHTTASAAAPPRRALSALFYVVSSMMYVQRCMTHLTTTKVPSYFLALTCNGTAPQVAVQGCGPARHVVVATDAEQQRARAERVSYSPGAVRLAAPRDGHRKHPWAAHHSEHRPRRAGARARPGARGVVADDEGELTKHRHPRSLLMRRRERWSGA